MPPNQTFATFGASTSERGSSDGDDMVSGTSGGVTFTLSAPSTATDYFLGLGDNLTVSNSDTSANNTFTLTWNAAGSTQASSIRLLGGFDLGEIVYLTPRGTVAAQSGVAFTGQVTGVQFSVSGPFDAAQITTLFLSINCFAPGTRIATPNGPRLVETLAKGDAVLTTDGRAVPVTWLGQQSIDARLAHPLTVNPIRITAGALGRGLPEQDLRITPDHAIEIDGTLYNAGTLVNGTTIYQDRGVLTDGFTYHHIETPAHELLLAEGLAVESFIDYAGRDAFDNGQELDHAISEMPLPRVSSARLVPDHIRTRLMPAIAAQ